MDRLNTSTPSDRTDPPQRLLVTGAAGFIGFHLCRRLLADGREVVGVDNLNDFYDVRLKKDRLALLTEQDGFTFEFLDIADKSGMDNLFRGRPFDRVINLAAQAGVRYSLENPQAYVESNLVGFTNILEGCRQTGVRHLVFASSSSVYGLNTNVPFSVHHNVDHPVSLYGATKKANELMAHTYSHIYGLPVTGLRFFTVYGPWGRPDMALFLFTKAILEGKPIKIFNYGKMTRDFTYIDDIIEGLVRVINRIAAPNPDWNGQAPDQATSPAPYRIYNIGNNRSVELMDFVAAIETALGRRAEKEYLPHQPGDVIATCADVTDLEQAVGFHPATPVQAGIDRFICWYKDYYGV